MSRILYPFEKECIREKTSIQLSLKISDPKKINSFVQNIINFFPAFRLKTDGENLIKCSNSDPIKILKLPSGLNLDSSNQWIKQHINPYSKSLATIACNHDTITFDINNSIADTILIAQGIDKLQFDNLTVNSDFPIALEQFYSAQIEDTDTTISPIEHDLRATTLYSTFQKEKLSQFSTKQISIPLSELCCYIQKDSYQTLHRSAESLLLAQSLSTIAHNGFHLSKIYNPEKDEKGDIIFPFGCDLTCTLRRYLGPEKTNPNYSSFYSHFLVYVNPSVTTTLNNAASFLRENIAYGADYGVLYGPLNHRIRGIKPKMLGQGVLIGVRKLGQLNLPDGIEDASFGTANSVLHPVLYLNEYTVQKNDKQNGKMKLWYDHPGIKEEDVNNMMKSVCYAMKNMKWNSSIKDTINEIIQFQQKH